MKLYSFYDIVGDSVVNVLQARNDDMMLRNCVKLPDEIQADHFVLICIGDMDESGRITPEYRKICKLSQASEELDKRLSVKEF